MISFALESPGFESHTDILSLSFLSIFMLFLLLLRDNAGENLDLWSHHLWQTILTHGSRMSLSMAVRDFSVSACLSRPRIKLLSQAVHHCYMRRFMTKPTKWHVRPAKTQISLCIRPVWSCCPHEESLGSFASSYPLNAQRRLWCPEWSESWLGAQSFCWFCHEVARI